MKRLLSFLLLMGSVGMALADDVTCFLPANKRTVKALPNEQLTLGIPDPNSGRTVCYRWSSSDCSSCFSGPTDQPTVNVTMPSEIGTYHFTVKKISDHVQTCEVVVTVESDIEIVSVTPKLSCYSYGDDISEDQFEIVTEPAGLEKYVKLDNSSKHATCPAYTSNNCNQTLTFIAYMNGQPRDYEYVDVIVNATASHSEEITIPKDIQNFITQIRGAGDVLKYLRDVSKTMNGYFHMVPGSPALEFTLDEPDVNVSVKSSKGVCCIGKSDQSQVDLGIVGSVGGKWTFYYPVYMLGIPCPPTVNLQGEIGASVSVDADVSINTCTELTLDLDLVLTAYASGGISWGHHSDILYGAVTLYVEPSLTGTWHILPPSNFGIDARGDISVGLDVMYSSKWFEDEKHYKVVFFTWRVY